jgi:Holliday junction resolvasome RuvABC endonuclease subunit
MKRVLGLDASSTTIGLCLLEYDSTNIQLKHVDFYKPPKKGNIFERLQEVRLYIYNLIDRWNPDSVAIEDIVLFMKGKSTAKTITTLAVFNRTVGLAALDKMGSFPHLYNVMSVRHKIKKDKKIPKKEDVPERVADILNIDFPYKLNRKNNPIKENGDMADAIAVALCHIYTERINE